MYSTKIGNSELTWNSREEAYQAAHRASLTGWRYVNILLEGELECRVITKQEDGGVILWTPCPSDKWSCSTFFRDVNQMDDIVFRSAM